MQADSEMSALLIGLELMLAGMGTVVVFLTLLIFTTRAMSAAVLRWAPARSAPDPIEPVVSEDELAAIWSAHSLP